MMSKFISLESLVGHLASLKEHEMAKLCDALVDDPRLRDLIEMIDAYLYISNEDSLSNEGLQALNFIGSNPTDRELN